MAATEAPIDVLLDYLKRSRGFDFTGYKRSSLERRIARRIDAVGVQDYVEYADYLEVHPDEFAALFNTILINVTGFFRDAPAWDYMATEVIPRLLQTIGDDAPIRVWCAGCASGEETYTMAIVLAELLGQKAYMERVKIYATDADEDALNEARHATYTAKQVEGVAPELLERYFDHVDERYVFRKDLRRSVIFGRNDLMQDAPISRIDLLTCRNTLMYFNAETQARILNRFHFAINDWGYVFLGKSEMLITHSDLFKPINLKRRVFTKVAKPTMRDRLLFVAHPSDGASADGAHGGAIRDSAFDAAPVAQAVVDLDGALAAINRAARELFGVSPADVGRPLKDLELSYRPVDLRSNLDTAYLERRSIVLASVPFKPPVGDGRELEVHITPLSSGGDLLGATISFEDVTAQRRLQSELETSKRELEDAYEELQSTVEELETTNEELQSTNEELETTNEELQSTNEELETMNEELQSTNQELETINEELGQRTIELNEGNAFLETILTSMGIAVVVVDRSQTVQVWNGHAADLWGMRADEVEGQHLLGLDIGLPVAELKSALGAVLSGREERVERMVDATNRRGKAIRCRVSCLPLSVVEGEVSGAILLMELAGVES
jgi:two-component system CheB/CheR fusion protein